MRYLTVLLALAALLGSTACDPAAPPPPAPTPTAMTTPTATPSPTPPAGGTFRYGIGAPTAIIPPLAATTDDRAVVDAVFDSLTAWDEAGRAIPAAAVSWTPNDDASRWTFELREGAVFHDGTAVTAADFRAAWDLLAAGGAMAHLLEDVVGHRAVRAGEAESLAGVVVNSPTVLDVMLVRPRADWPVVVGHPALGPVQQASLRTDPDGYASLPVGNGPFRMTEPWARGDFIRAARWDGWRNGERSPEGIAEVLFRIADLDINFLAFSQGRRDFTAVPPDGLDLAAAEYPATGGAWDGPGLITGGRPEMYLLAVNRQVPPYDDRTVREAVSLILDRAAIAADNAGGNLVPASSLLPPALPGARVGLCELCTFNPVAAGERLAAAGVSQLTFAFNAAGGHERIRTALRAGLSGIGVGLVSNGRQPPPPLPEYQAALAEGDIGLFRLPLSADVPSALSMLHPLLHGDRVPEAGGQNYLRYDDPTVTALLDQAARTLADLPRERLLRRVEEIALNRDHVVIPVVSYQHAVVASDAVRGLRYGPFGLLNLTELVLEP